MIPKENIYKDNVIKFRNTLLPPEVVMHNIYYPSFINRMETERINENIKDFLENNIIIPLEFVSSNLNKGEPGCRIYDWKILTTPQVKSAMKISGNYNIIKVPYCPPITLALSLEEDEQLNTNKSELEVYDKFLNVTYLVNDNFLQSWIEPETIKKYLRKELQIVL